MSPKVFISHASEDKDRFILEFATRLRSKGVDAWIDRWEMLPGDSLVDKVFEEGIRNAQAVIVVLSRYSVNKKWVREELNAAFIKRINESSKLIPVIIDNCEVPEALKSTIWETISDINHYDAEFDHILMSIFGKYEKPVLGSTPPYARASFDALTNLTEVNSVVFKSACEIALPRPGPLVATDSLVEKLNPYGLSKEIINESLEILDGRGYINATKVLSGEIPSFKIGWTRYEDYLRRYLPDYPSLIDKIAYMIVNEGKRRTESFCSELGLSVLIVNTILNHLESRRMITMAQFVDGSCEVESVLPELKRKLRTNPGNPAG